MSATDPGTPLTQRRHRAGGLVLVVAIAGIVYWRTAYPTITWWDSSQYSLAAVTLGITGPPGSLILTLLGWLVTRLPLGASPAHVLSLLAGALAAWSAGLVYLIALRLLRCAGESGNFRNGAAGGAILGAVLGGLTFAAAETFWEHAVQFTPYVLTTVFTGMILWTMLRWWEEAERDDAWHRLAVLGLLFGLDFSVHRTNLLLLPGLFVWIVLRHPRTLRSARAWIGGTAGMVAGLAFALLIIPLSASGPLLNMGNPSGWARFYDYVSLAQLGGGWLVHFFPRNAPFWSAQVMDLIRAFGANFLWRGGRVGVLGVLPALFGLLGIVLLWLRNRRLALALVLVLFVQAALTVLYFNIPAHFFRPLTRHYLPIFVTFAVCIAHGLGALLRAVWIWGGSRRRGWLVAAPAGVMLALVPTAQLVHNWTAVDGSDHWFTEDYASNALRGLPPHAILFTNGDNDTFPLWYVQAVEGVRPDVQVVNLPLTNAAWYVDQIAERDPSFPLSLTPEERHDLGMRAWADTTIAMPVSGTPDQLGLPRDTPIPNAIVLHAAPTVAGRYVRPQDLLVLRILEDNAWRRPLCFAVSVSPDNLAWLASYRRLDGLFWRIVPVADPAADVRMLRANLTETYAFRGYADPRVRLDDVSRLMGSMYYFAFMTMAEAEVDHGDAARCHETRERMRAVLPPARLGARAPTQEALDGLCGERQPSSARAP
jgi:hypothetical protein